MQAKKIASAENLIGAALLQGQFPLANHKLMVSARASFEIMQKALVARIRIVAAVSEPSSLAVDTARKFKMTLVGRKAVIVARARRKTVLASRTRGRIRAVFVIRDRVQENGPGSRYVFVGETSRFNSSQNVELTVLPSCPSFSPSLRSIQNGHANQFFCLISEEDALVLQKFGLGGLLRSLQADVEDISFLIIINPCSAIG